jgi:hypothetical protein
LVIPHASGKPEFEKCSDLPLNKPLRVEVPAKASRTTVQLSYTLLRKEEQVYDVYLNPKFIPSPQFASHYIDKKEVQEYFTKKMRECFNDSKHMLFDEHNRKLRLHVYEKGLDRIPAPPQVTINVQTETRRSNSSSCSTEIDCQTLVHESFHLLGLVDEYQEQSLGYDPRTFSSEDDPLVPVSESVLPAYDCRAEGPEFSLMKAPRYLGFGQNLFSGHLNTIIYPNCEARNERYYACAKFAYKTSAQHTGQAPTDSDCARNVPSICKTVEWLKVE